MTKVGTFILAVALIALAGGCSPDEAVEPEPHAPVAPVVETDGPASAPSMDPDQIEQGREIAESMCGGCHALDDATDSPRPDAPPMKVLLDGYDPDALADDLIEGVRIGHDDMPDFDFDVIGTDALVAYLRSISDLPAAE